MIYSAGVCVRITLYVCQAHRKLLYICNTAQARRGAACVFTDIHLRIYLGHQTSRYFSNVAYTSSDSYEKNTKAKRQYNKKHLESSTRFEVAYSL